MRKQKQFLGWLHGESLKSFIMDNQRRYGGIKMNKKYNKETYYSHLMKLLPESNFSLDIYTGTEEPCEITCNICKNHYIFSEAEKISRRARRGNKNVCKKCEKNDWTAKQKEAEYKAQYLLSKKGTIELVGKIKSWASRDNVTWKCKKCNHMFERSPYVLFSQNHLTCPWCETHPFEYSEEMIKQKSSELWGQEYTFLNIDKIKNKNGSKRALVCHNKCGFKYSVSLWNFLHGQGCPKCKASHGEKKVRDYLQKNNIIFLEQKIIKINDSFLKLDFYLEQKNGKKFAIEYNGIQHYQPVEYFNGEAGFKAQQQRDNNKKQYCKENNIELIVIPYFDESLLNSQELAQRLNG